MNKSRGLAFLYGAIVAGVVAMAGCSGGGGGATAAAPNVPGATPTPTPGPTATGVQQTATAILTFPHGKAAGIGPDYVSPNSTTVSYQIKLVNGQPPPSWVQSAPTTAPLVFKQVTGGPPKNCSTNNGMATCSVTIPAPPGNVDYIIATYNQASAVLDYGEEVIQIKQGINNQVAITLAGVVHSVNVTAKPLVPNTDTTETVTLTAFDASGAQITGTQPFQSPFKLEDDDQYTTNKLLEQYSSFLTVNGQPMNGSKQVQINSPADVIQIVYNGIAMSDITIVAAGSTGKDGPFNSKSTISLNLYPIVLPGTMVDNAANGGQPSDPNYNQNTLLLHAGDPAYSITPTELGRTNFPYDTCNQKQSFTCFGLQDLPLTYAPCETIAPFNPGPPGKLNGYTYTITPLSAGLCLEQFIDGLTPGHSAPPNGNPLANGEIWVKVQ